MMSSREWSSLRTIFGFPTSGFISFAHRTIEILYFKKCIYIVVPTSPFCSLSRWTWWGGAGSSGPQGMKDGPAGASDAPSVAHSAELPHTPHSPPCLAPPGSALPKLPVPRGESAPDKET